MQVFKSSSAHQNSFSPLPTLQSGLTDGMDTRLSQHAREWEELKNNQPFQELMWQLFVNVDPLAISKLIRFSDITGRAVALSLEECCGEKHTLANRIRTDYGQFFEKPQLSSEFYLAGSEAQLVADICYFGICEDEEKTCSKVAHLQTLLGCGNIGGNATPFPGEIWKQIKDHLSPDDRGNLRATSHFLCPVTGSRPMAIDFSKIRQDAVACLSDFIGKLKEPDVNLTITKGNSHRFYEISIDLFNSLFNSLQKNEHITVIRLSALWYTLHSHAIKSLGGLAEKLTSFDLTDHDLRGQDVKGLANLTNLTSLTLSRNGLKFLPLLPTKLTSLNLSNNWMCHEDVKGLANLTNLTWLNLSRNDLKFLPLLPTKLTSLNLSNNKLCDKEVLKLATLTNLTSLNISQNPLKARPDLALALLTELTSLDIGWNI